MEYTIEIEYEMLENQICSLPGKEFRRWLRFVDAPKKVKGYKPPLKGSEIRWARLLLMRQFAITLRADYVG